LEAGKLGLVWGKDAGDRGNRVWWGGKGDLNTNQVAINRSNGQLGRGNRQGVTKRDAKMSNRQKGKESKGAGERGGRFCGLETRWHRFVDRVSYREKSSSDNRGEFVT